MQQHNRSGFTLVELMVVVAILAVLAVVAIPSYLSYARRAKTVEAIDELEKIHQGSAVYYARGQVLSGTGAAVPCQFPGSQGMTPDLTGKACCGGVHDGDGDARCDVDATAWTTPTWSALSFEMRDQHYFAYSYASSGVLSNATFVARANADLDCDGVYSTFERYGYGDAGASNQECSARSGAALFISVETE